MRLIISLLVMFFSSIVYSEVDIYANDYSSMAIERQSGNDPITATIYGGSSDMGAASPADCLVKFKLSGNDKGFSGIPVPFGTGIMSYSQADFQSEENKVFFERYKNGMIFLSQDSFEFCPLQTNFVGYYHHVNQNSKDYQTIFNELIDFNYQNAAKEYSKGNIDNAIKLLKPYLKKAIELNYYTPRIYNDYGYFLQEKGENKEAIEYFKIVIRKSPDRVAAYLNVADSYRAEGNKSEAEMNYNKYISLMKKMGLKTKYRIGLWKENRKIKVFTKCIF